MTSQHIYKISKKLNEDLPGWEAQKTMSPIRTSKYRSPLANSKKASVMVLLYPDEQDFLNTYFIKRANSNPGDKHGGQISFPGGQQDKEDKNSTDTALRETFEEIGVDPKSINVLGSLTPIYVYASNFYVEPFIGYVGKKPKLKLQKSEVDYIIDVPVNKLLDPTTVQKTDFQFRSFKVKDMLYYNIDGEVLWGATAMITAEFLQVLRSV